MSHALAWVRRFWPVALVGLVHCAPPLQNGGVEVLEGADARLQTVCKWRRGDGRPAECFAESSQAPPSHAFVIENDEQLLRGPHALGRPGDVMLDNGEIAAVVAAVGRSSGPLADGGVLIDVGDARHRVDQLGMLAPTVHTAPRHPTEVATPRGWIAEALQLGSDPDGVAWVEVRGRLDGDDSSRVRTRFALAPGQRVVHVSTWADAGPTSTGRYVLGDEVHWGSSVPQPTRSTLDAVGTVVGYSLIPAKGWSGHAGEGALRRVYGATAEASRPPESDSGYHRFLAVSVRGDSLALASELAFLSGRDLGALTVGFIDERGRPVPAPTSGIVELRRSSQSRLDLRVAGARTGGFPFEVQAEAPIGTYVATYRGPGGRSLAPTEVRVVPGEVARAAIELRPLGKLGLRIADGAGGLVTIASADTGEVVLSAEPVIGERTVALPPGRYRVLAMRDLEHARVEREVELLPGKVAAVDLSLESVIDPGPLVGCELVRGALFGFDSRSIGARLKARWATGGACLIVTERGALVDVDPIVQSLGASSLVVVSALESPARRKGLGLSLVAEPPSSVRGRWAKLTSFDVMSPRAQTVAPGLWNVPGAARRPSSSLPAPRLYVRARRDGAGRLDEADLQQALLDGRGAVLTRGPLLRAQLHDVGIGGVATLDATAQRMRLTVERARWVDVDRIDVLVDGEVRFELPIGDSAEIETSGASTEEYDMLVTRSASASSPDGVFDPAGRALPRIVVDADAAVTFVVHGADGEAAEPVVVATTSPLWIDADGDGRVFGRH